MAYIGSQPANIRAKDREVFTYTVAADNTTTFSGNDDAGRKLVYSLTTGNIEVFLNGIRLAAADYTATSSTSVVLAVGAYSGDIVNIITYNVLPVSDTVSKYNGGTFEGAVSFGNDIVVTGDANVLTDVNVTGDVTAQNVRVSGGQLLVETGADNPMRFTTTDGSVGSPTWAYTEYYAEGASGSRTAYIGVSPSKDFLIGNNSNGSMFILDSTGRVRLPYQPSFTAGRNAGTVSAGTYYVFNAVSHNIGNHYNATTGRFTAPVSGSYLVSFQNILGSGNTTTNNDAQLHINGGRIGETRSEDRTGLWSTASLTKVVYMNAGDYLQIYADTGSHYGSDAFWCTFSGYLLG